jgi:AmiR/NasT family two-component response regulator
LPEIEKQHLRVLIANERNDTLDLLAEVVTGLGHEVVARDIDVREVAASTGREHPDVALVELGLSSEHALGMISEIVRNASCPVIAILHSADPRYVSEAAKRGVFAYISENTPEELQSAIEITLHRFAEYENLQHAFGRRATIEQAKGVLMARYLIDPDAAFERLREHAESAGLKVAEVAAAVVESHVLLAAPAARELSP